MTKLDGTVTAVIKRRIKRLVKLTENEIGEVIGVRRTIDFDACYLRALNELTIGE